MVASESSGESHVRNQGFDECGAGHSTAMKGIRQLTAGMVTVAPTPNPPKEATVVLEGLIVVSRSRMALL
jgi:hypothetical protein